MRDDLYDIIDAHGNKTPFSDHQEGNQTFLFAYAYAHATPDQQTYFIETRGKTCTEESRKKLLHIYEHTGTIEWATTQINTLLDTARLSIQQRHTDSRYDHTYIQHLIQIVDYLVVSS